MAKLRLLGDRAEAAKWVPYAMDVLNSMPQGCMARNKAVPGGWVRVERYPSWERITIKIGSQKGVPFARVPLKSAYPGLMYSNFYITAIDTEITSTPDAPIALTFIRNMEFAVFERVGMLFPKSRMVQQFSLTAAITHTDETYYISYPRFKTSLYEVNYENGVLYPSLLFSNFFGVTPSIYTVRDIGYKFSALSIQNQIVLSDRAFFAVNSFYRFNVALAVHLFNNKDPNAEGTSALISNAYSPWLSATLADVSASNYLRMREIYNAGGFAVDSLAQVIAEQYLSMEGCQTRWRAFHSIPFSFYATLFRGMSERDMVVRQITLTTDSISLSSEFLNNALSAYQSASGYYSSLENPDGPSMFFDGLRAFIEIMTERLELLEELLRQIDDEEEPSVNIIDYINEWWNEFYPQYFIFSNSTMVNAYFSSLEEPIREIAYGIAVKTLMLQTFPSSGSLYLVNTGTMYFDEIYDILVATPPADTGGRIDFSWFFYPDGTEVRGLIYRHNVASIDYAIGAPVSDFPYTYLAYGFIQISGHSMFQTGNRPGIGKVMVYDEEFNLYDLPDWLLRLEPLVGQVKQDVQVDIHYVSGPSKDFGWSFTVHDWTVQAFIAGQLVASGSISHSNTQEVISGYIGELGLGGSPNQDYWRHVQGDVPFPNTSYIVNKNPNDGSTTSVPQPWTDTPNTSAYDFAAPVFVNGNFSIDSYFDLMLNNNLEASRHFCEAYGLMDSYYPGYAALFSTFVEFHRGAWHAHDDFLRTVSKFDSQWSSKYNDMIRNTWDSYAEEQLYPGSRDTYLAYEAALLSARLQEMWKETWFPVIDEETRQIAIAYDAFNALTIGGNYGYSYYELRQVQLSAVLDRNTEDYFDDVAFDELPDSVQQRAPFFVTFEPEVRIVPVRWAVVMLEYQVSGSTEWLHAPWIQSYIRRYRATSTFDLNFDDVLITKVRAIERRTYEQRGDGKFYEKSRTALEGIEFSFDYFIDSTPYLATTERFAMLGNAPPYLVRVDDYDAPVVQGALFPKATSDEYLNPYRKLDDDRIKAARTALKNDAPFTKFADVIDRIMVLTLY